ncbi:MAG: gamma-glutamyl-gamma-aminobutyrate hydrolase family protein [Aestuariivita sp.]|nr:gamma-glutamyl-gamma-aminobutyrate hydrolase family protein [Aestuariivita sp.]MCY4202942.1 gamma-glutamyl-gamma-aminobutyrate hydrolase family protein [Aestuariivita sp.]
MARPVVGIIGNMYLIDGQYAVHAAGLTNSEAVASVTDCLPMLVPADPSVMPVDELIEICDGFLLTGGRPNIHPEEYGEVATKEYGEFDRARDALTLPLIRSCVERGQPFLGICRGFQEVNVAMGGTLYPEIRDLPGRMNHRMPPDGTLNEKFALRHKVILKEGSIFHRLFGAREVTTNTLHGQGIKKPGKRIIVEGHASDGTPEAIRVAQAPGFTLSVQWHPEWNASRDAVSRPLFEAFGDAVRAWRSGTQQRPFRRAG